ncbi:MAG: hypothetical protein QXE79_03420, partial [Candidatus Bathyarchaeia archaeon]
AIGFAARDLAEHYGWIPSITKTLTETLTQTQTVTETTTINPVVKYALDKGIDPEVANNLSVLKELNPNNETLIDYLFTINNIVPPNESQKETVKSLQLKVLYGEEDVSGVLTDEDVSDEEAYALSYLSGFDSETQKGYIEFGLAPDVSSYLSLNSSFPDQDFARYAVQNRVCMQTHHNLTDIGATYLTRLDKSYSNNPEVVEELTKLPDLLDVDERDLAALDNILFLVDESKNNAVYQKAFASMLSEGIKGKRKYCSPLEALLWLAYDRDFRRSNLLENYSLKSLINVAWKQSSASRNYKSDRWKNFAEVVNRLNSPDLVSAYMSNNIRYEDDPLNITQNASMTFIKKAGDCEDHAMFALYCLINNGYSYNNFDVFDNNAACGLDVQWGKIGSRNALGHAVCLYKKDNLFYYLDNSGFKKGPFNSIENVVNDINPTWKRYTFFNIYFQITHEVKR